MTWVLATFNKFNTISQIAHNWTRLKERGCWTRLKERQKMHTGPLQLRNMFVGSVGWSEVPGIFQIQPITHTRPPLGRSCHPGWTINTGLTNGQRDDTISAASTRRHSKNVHGKNTLQANARRDHCGQAIQADHTQLCFNFEDRRLWMRCLRLTAQDSLPNNNNALDEGL